MMCLGAAPGLSCGGGKSPTSPSLPASLVFTQSPLETVNIGYITPIGNLNPPGHTVPTDHMYLYHPTPVVPVTAPAGGTIIEARHGADDALYVQAATGVMYYLAHLILDAGISTGGTITAGQRLGTTSSLALALDLGVSNDAVTLFFVTPARYPTQTIHADSPLKYFQEPVRGTLYGLVRRSGADKDGKIDFDQAGRLSGNWFKEGLPINDSMNVVNGPQHLAFARDVWEPTQLRVSIGGSLSISGGFWLEEGVLDPAQVTPASGPVGYRLFNNALRTGPGDGVLIVQMVAPGRIQIETFPAGTPLTTAFTNASLFYVR
jgi:hypothetical protein